MNRTMLCTFISAAIAISAALAPAAMAQQRVPVGAIDARIRLSDGQAMVDFVRQSGYRCDVPEQVRPCLWGDCFVVICDKRWTYTLRESPRGGYSITVG